jgi:2-polyprenyl-3-methyl-5-hydroxy-6-metoxy-1,4-benzoquinol methylase
LGGYAMANTKDYYNANAADYFAKTVNLDVTALYTDFLGELHKGDKILDVGCGSGRDSKAFLDMGYDVTSVDGSIKLAKLASAYIGREVLVRDFKEILYADEFNGIWAMSSLLHLPKKDTLQVYKNLFNALKINGIMYVCYKNGDSEREDGNRLFNDYTEEQFREFIGTNFTNILINKTWMTGSVAANSKDQFVNILMKKKL